MCLCCAERPAPERRPCDPSALEGILLSPFLTFRHLTHRQSRSLQHVRSDGLQNLWPDVDRFCDSWLGLQRKPSSPMTSRHGSKIYIPTTSGAERDPFFGSAYFVPTKPAPYCLSSRQRSSRDTDHDLARSNRGVNYCTSSHHATVAKPRPSEDYSLRSDPASIPNNYFSSIHRL